MESFLDKLIPSINDDDKNIDLSMLLLIMSLPDPDKPYNIYKYSKYDGFYEFMNALDDIILITSFELLLDALESCGVSINDTPAYREIMEDIYKEQGAKFIEETYDIYDMLRSDIYKIIRSEYDVDSETEVLTRFLQTAKHYTNINSVVAKMYDILQKHGESLLSISDDVFLNNKYADVMMTYDLDKNIHNDFMLEYVTTDIKDKHIFAFTYYEYIGKIHISRGPVEIDTNSGIRNLFKRFVNGEDIHHTCHVLHKNNVSEFTNSEEFMGEDILEVIK